MLDYLYTIVAASVGLFLLWQFFFVRSKQPTHAAVKTYTQRQQQPQVQTISHPAYVAGYYLGIVTGWMRLFLNGKQDGVADTLRQGTACNLAGTDRTDPVPTLSTPVLEEKTEGRFTERDIRFLKAWKQKQGKVSITDLHMLYGIGRNTMYNFLNTIEVDDTND